MFFSIIFKPRKVSSNSYFTYNFKTAQELKIKDLKSCCTTKKNLANECHRELVKQINRTGRLVKKK